MYIQTPSKFPFTSLLGILITVKFLFSIFSVLILSFNNPNRITFQEILALVVKSVLCFLSIYPSTTFGGPPPFRQGRHFYSRLFSTLLLSLNQFRNKNYLLTGKVRKEFCKYTVLYAILAVVCSL